MSEPLVTLGVPVYRGQEMLPITLECLRTQSYANLDVLVSVDGGDQASFDAAKPFLSDPRFRIQMHPSRLGWAGNMDWTIRHRRGAFYIYQQHDDQVSPTYVADLVAAASRWPAAAICYSQMRISGSQNRLVRAKSTLGEPLTRALIHMERLDASMLRGLIRSSALDRTSGILTNEFEGYGSEHRFMAELALAGEFRFVQGPTYYKRLHGGNLHLKWYDWPEERKRAAWAHLAASMLEVIVPVGRGLEDRQRLFETIFERFLVSRGPLSGIRNHSRSLYKRNRNAGAALLLALIDRLRNIAAVEGWMLSKSRVIGCRIDSPETRATIAQMIVQHLQANRRFDPVAVLASDWSTLELAAVRRFGTSGSI